MDMISIAQSTGDISADIYRQKSAKPIATPQLAGLEKHNQKLQEDMQAAQNPFTHGSSTSAATVPNGASLLRYHAIDTASCSLSTCCLCGLDSSSHTVAVYAVMFEAVLSSSADHCNLSIVSTGSHSHQTNCTWLPHRGTGSITHSFSTLGL